MKQIRKKKLRTYLNFIHFLLVYFFRFFGTYPLGFQMNLALHFTIKTFHRTSTLRGSHFVYLSRSSRGLAPRARSFKLRMGTAIRTAASRCLPQRGYFLPWPTFNREAMRAEEQFSYMKTPPFSRIRQSDCNAEQCELFRTKTNGRKAYRLIMGL